MESQSFLALWQKMTPDERKFARAEMESDIIAKMPPAFLRNATEAQIRRAAKSQVSDLIDHCKRTA